MKGKKKALAGTRRVQKVGGSLKIAIPADFIAAHNIKEGDDLPYAANHMIAYVPVKGKEEANNG